MAAEKDGCRRQHEIHGAAHIPQQQSFAAFSLLSSISIPGHRHFAGLSTVFSNPVRLGRYGSGGEFLRPPDLADIQGKVTAVIFKFLSPAIFAAERFRDSPPTRSLRDDARLTKGMFPSSDPFVPPGAPLTAPADAQRKAHTSSSTVRAILPVPPKRREAV